MDKLVSGYQAVYGGQLDDDVILGKCRNAISCIEKVDKEIGGDVNSGISWVVPLDKVHNKFECSSTSWLFDTPIFVNNMACLHDFISGFLIVCLYNLIF